jgi:hypothetical protein
MSSFQQPPQEKSSALPLCAKGCGFFGSLDTQNMCSVCFINHRLVAMSVNEVAPKDAVVEEEEAAVTPTEIRKVEAEEWKKRVKKAAENPYYTNRCTQCLKKMGSRAAAARPTAPSTGSRRITPAATTTSALASSPSSATTRSSSQTSCATGSELLKAIVG